MSRTVNGEVLVTELDGHGTQLAPTLRLPRRDFPAFVLTRENAEPRWVWDDTSRWSPTLLAEGIRVRRCHDLRLCHAILRGSALTSTSELGRREAGPWDLAPAAEVVAVPPGATLFDLFDVGDVRAGDVRAGDARGGAARAGDARARGVAAAATTAGARSGNGDPDDGSLAEFLSQLEAVASCPEPGRLRLLLAAESVGALIAAEMQFAGLPWSTDIHDSMLTAELGPRVAHGTRPERLEQLATRIRRELDDPMINLDSQQELLKSLRRAGLMATSTRAWELRKLEHPVIGPLLEYKKLARLLSANGWYWMDTWIVNGRFHPEYVPGAAATGRWGASGGGPLQLPRQVRAAVVADEGWKLVVADAAQLEPRILAALSADTAMAAAGRGTDLYAGIVASGVVETRDHAKVAMLGAMYGATTGESGRLLPRLARAYPRALGLTETAARAGERGDIVTTRLGRSSPRPGQSWQAAQAQAYDPAASAADERRARSQARDWGRFTRNFVVQGSAAEWALCWMAEVRRELWSLRDAGAPGRATVFEGTPHLVFFLHDEVIVHTPAALAGDVERIITRAAETAGRLLFGDFPVDFLLTVATVDSYADAK